MQFRLAVLILAGGASERYGSNKLLSMHPSGKTLLQRVIDVCHPLCSFRSPVIVTGRWHSSLLNTIRADRARLVYNPRWEQGIGRSIAFGVEFLLSEGNDCLSVSTDVNSPSHILVVLGDMPLITTDSVGALVNTMHHHPDKIIVSEWQQNKTVPAIFPAGYFSALQALDSDEGAKKILKRVLSEERPNLIAVSHPQAGVDIDTPTDWHILSEN